ncbi:hypothetical protein X801_00081 [Opisthorchis viverrini]|uniref:Uncharacterized protein n=1 Tax=Opisthorchis viverrini TaxID=6198 RepID=A0A1S8XBD1_OPIVI|nr:hypothetical protein X801_00081 [Opisthorchis viverrini]
MTSYHIRHPAHVYWVHAGLAHVWERTPSAGRNNDTPSPHRRSKFNRIRKKIDEDSQCSTQNGVSAPDYRSKATEATVLRDVNTPNADAISVHYNQLKPANSCDPLNTDLISVPPGALPIAENTVEVPALGASAVAISQ